MSTDIRDANDVKIIVDHFYARAAKDELLGPVFSGILDPNHDKAVLHKYWCSVLLDASHGGNSFPSHIELMSTRRHFVRWLNLFISTIDAFYAGPVAERGKIMVIRKSEEFQSRLALSRF